jgi:hypothetical protein
MSDAAATLESPSQARVSGRVAALFEAAARPLPPWSDFESVLAAPDVHPRIATEAARLIQSEAGFEAFADHEALIRRGSAAERLAFYAVSRRLGAKAAKARRRLLDGLDEAPSPLDELRIDRATGVLVTAQGGWAPVAEAVDEARARLVSSRDEAAADNAGKRFMSTIPLGGEVMDSAVMRLGRHPAVLRLVGRYLEGLPILYRINLLESSNEALEDGSSQFFHIDPEDFRQVKIFLLVEDVSEASGPLHLLAADASDKVRVAFDHRHGRLGDEAVMDVAGAAALTACTGPAGTLAIGDTSRCFHFGSRPGRRRRQVLMYQYLTPFACAFPLDGSSVGSKYDKGLRKAIKRGAEITELDQRLFGVVR